MEDLNNNEDYAFVPDFLMPDLFTSKDLLSPDEQSVPVFDQGFTGFKDQFSAAEVWHESQENFGQVHNSQVEHHDTGYNYDGALNHPTQRTYHPTIEGARPLNEDATNLELPSSSLVVPSTSLARPTLPCPVCYRTFKHKLSLTNHQRSHAIKQPHLCTICGETFKYKTNFKRHRRVHAKEMKMCRYCGTNMDSDYDLVHHEKEHRRQQKQL